MLSGYAQTVLVDQGSGPKITKEMPVLGGVKSWPPTAHIMIRNYIGLLVILPEAVFAHASIQ